MSLPRVSVGIIIFGGGEKYLPYSIRSILDQRYPGEVEYLFLDYGPNYADKKLLEKEISDIFPQKIGIYSTPEKMWHSGGHNFMMRKMTGQYYVCASNDMLYAPDFLEKIISGLENHPKYSVATGKLLQWNYARQEKTDLIDSTGIGLLENHYFFDTGQGCRDTGQFDERKEIFGPSGGLAVFKKSALDAIAFRGQNRRVEYFDELLHYKDDVDLAYRLNWAGYKSLFVAEAKAWHDRQAGIEEASPGFLRSIIRSRKNKQRWVKENSFFGHLVLLRKNFWGRGFSLRTRLKVGWHLFRAVCFGALLEPYLLKQFAELSRHSTEVAEKKRAMKIAAKPEDIVRFFSNRTDR